LGLSDRTNALIRNSELEAVELDERHGRFEQVTPGRHEGSVSGEQGNVSTKQETADAFEEFFVAGIEAADDGEGQFTAQQLVESFELV